MTTTRLPDNRSRRRLVLGSRMSELALWQTNLVARELAVVAPKLEIEIKQFSTEGDQQIDQPLTEIGGKGLFTTELNDAIEQGVIDVAIHSLKDLPTESSPSIVVMPVLSREDPRDVLVSRNSRTLSQLGAGAVIGTSSLRRQSQLLAIRPDLNVRSIRGNVPTRISKLESDDYAAVILAAAGVLRLGLQNSISDWFSLADMLPAPGQGAIAATLRRDDPTTHDLMNHLGDPATIRRVTAERTFLAAMGGGCSSPIAAHACFHDTGSKKLVLTGRIGSIDGSDIITMQLNGTDPKSLGSQLAASILDGGGREILTLVDEN